MYFVKDKHIKYLQRCLGLLPSRLSSLDISRLTVTFFAVSGIDLLNDLSCIEEKKQNIINWVYSLQVLPNKDGSRINQCGFRGSAVNGVFTTESQESSSECIYDCGHIAMTYSGLATLLILGDDLSKINKNAIIQGLRHLQQPDGSFRPLSQDGENDMRFVFCASCICYMLNDWSGMDTELASLYIHRSLTYEGGVAQGPGFEAHGGSTYCAVAALTLMGRLKSSLSSMERSRLERWCLFKQEEGFQGRPNKPEDTCYSFWVGATLKLLGAYQFVDFEKNCNFVCSTQDEISGGLSKWPDGNPDALHTFLGIAGLALGESLDIQPINAALNISQRATEHLLKLHKTWT